MRTLFLALLLAAPLAARAQSLPDDAPVRLPWPELAGLLRQARAARTEAIPLPYLVGAATAEGRVEGRSLELTVTQPLFLLGDGWTAIPLWRSPATVRRATLDGAPASVVADGDLLLVLARGKGTHQLRAELVLPDAASHRASLPFATPVAVRWSLSLPGAGARLSPVTRSTTRRSRAGEVTIDAVTPPAARIELDWSGDSARAGPARLTAELLTRLTFEEGTSRGTIRAALELSGGGRDRVALRLPAGLEVLTVDAAELSGWAVEPSGDGQRLVATFRREQRGRVQLELRFELATPAERALLPAPWVEEAAEQRAWVAAAAEPPLSLAPGAIAGGEAVDPGDLPGHLLRGSRAPVALAFRHGTPGDPAAPLAAEVRLERLEAVPVAQATIDAAYFTTVLTDEGREVVKATFLVKNNLRPFLGVTLPEGATLTAAFVSGEAVIPATQGDRVLLPLVKSRAAGAGQTVHLVEEGWSLTDVALLHYHDASKWRLIAQENRDTLDDEANPATGQLLRIPRLAGPDGGDLETAFPVELAYWREREPPGRLGSLALTLPVPELEAMRVVWTVALPSRLDPLSFRGNLTQASYLRYGLFRRLQGLLAAGAALPPGALLGTNALAGGNLRERFHFEGSALDGSGTAHPRVSLPLVGTSYVFKQYLLAGEPPRLSVVYLDRALEPPLRRAIFLAGLLLSLWLGRAVQRGGLPALPGKLPVAFGYVALVLLAGHFVLGSHAHALLGLLAGAWLRLLVALARRARVTPGLFRAPGLLGLANCAALLLLVLAGPGVATGILALLAAAGAALYLRGTGARPAAAATATLLWLLSASEALAQELPGAQVTVPLGTLRELLPPAPAPALPRDASVVSASYTATFEGDAISVRGALVVDVHAPGWVSLPLSLGEQPVLALTVDAKPWALPAADGGAPWSDGEADEGGALHLHGQGRHEVRFELLVAIPSPGAAPLRLVPGVASSLTLGGFRGLDPEVAGATDVREEADGVVALVPPSGRVELLWTPVAAAAPGAAPAGAPAAARVVARTLQIVAVDERRLRSFALVRYGVQRGGVSTFRVALPDGVELLDVQADGAPGHEVIEEEGRRILVVHTAATIRDELELSFVYDAPHAPGGAVLPRFEVLDVRSETGTLGIEAAGNLEIRLAEVAGAAAIDVRSAPELFAHTDRPILHAIRYLQPYEVRLALARHPEIALEAATVDRASYTTVVTRDGRAITEGRFKLRNARRPYLELELPAASELESAAVGGQPARPVRSPDGKILLPLPRSPPEERELRQLEVELVFTTKLPPGEELPRLLPALDLRVSKLSWALHLPPGMELTKGPTTASSIEYMQWASAPRAFLAAAITPRDGEESVTAGGLLPVRFQLPTHGEPETFWLHYLPAGSAPSFAVAYGPRSMHPAVHGAGALLVLGVLAFLLGLGLRRARATAPATKG